MTTRRMGAVLAALATAATGLTLSLGAVAPVEAAPGGRVSAAAPDPSRPLVISEFRVRGPNGANDEFIEITNLGSTDHTVVGAAGAGYGVAASDGVSRCSIPNGTVIPAFGSYLCVNSAAYSLAGMATGDATFTTDIPDNAGIALFNNDNGGGDYVLANRLDAVGSTSEANTLYKEGAGYNALTPFSIDYSFYRNLSTASISDADLTTDTPGLPEDTDNNATDFVFVDTNGTSAGAGQRLGAPGPSNLASPRSNGDLDVSLLDECSGWRSPPNAVRNFVSDPANNSTFGTEDIRRTITNNTGGNVTALRIRVADIRTFPAPGGIADYRPRTSTAVVVTVDRAPCGSGTSNVTVQGTTLQQPPTQWNGGGFNSVLTVPTVTGGTPLAPGESIDVRFLMGIQQTGANSVQLVVEAITTGTDNTYDAGTCVAGNEMTSMCAVCAGQEPTVLGTAGNDTLTGTAGPDVIVGGGGADTINALGGDDLICGKAGDDIIDAGEGDDVVYGHEGDDYIAAQGGTDTLRGGFGDDDLDGGPDADGDYLNGGPGTDDLAGGVGNDTLQGGDGPDTITGGNGNDTISGGDGDDPVLDGEANDDTVLGGNGNDGIDGGGGVDSVNGGPGADTVDGGEGGDTIAGGPGADTVTGGSGVDRLTGAEGIDTLTGNGGADVLLGGTEGDTLNGGAGDDRLIGGAGADTLNGDDDADILRGGTEDDALNGGAGDDRLFGDAGTDTLDGGTGTNHLVQ
ncbi:calcium-binding protein [Nocardioides stalactiti]|uniref:calcium-binding protein n=1 Tax=Nocardioides stalactiti TaxID=2755356 RepID=UPI0016020E32|nr:calcium-binding protein [Nocardioides stalactiti]